MPSITRFAVDTRPLRIADFRRLWLAGLVTAVGGQFAVIAVPKQIYDLTGTSAYVGIAGLVTFFCLAASALWGGSLADLFDRRRVLLVTSSGVAATAALFFAVFDVATPLVLLGLVGLQAGFVGANMSAMGAAIPRLVPGELLAAASSLAALVRYLGSIAGPLLAGVLMPAIGLRWLYFIDAVALCATVWAVSRLPAIAPAGTAQKRPSLRHIGSGFKYLMGERILLAVLLADLSAMVLGFPMALYPELAHRVFGDPPGGGFALGLLYAAYPAGVIAMGLVSGTFTRLRRHGVIVTVAVCAWGFTLVGFGLSTYLWWALAFLTAGGAVNFLLSTFRNAITQSRATDEMRGRTQGALIVITMGGPSLANLVHGLAGAAIGPALAIAAGGVLTVVAMVAVALAFPDFWRYRAPVSR